MGSYGINQILNKNIGTSDVVLSIFVRFPTIWRKNKSVGITNCIDTFPETSIFPRFAWVKMRPVYAKDTTFHQVQDKN